MPRPKPGIHYLRANHQVSTPKSVLYLDTETRVIPGSDPEVQALRLWAARHTDRHPTRTGRQESVTNHGVNTRELVQWIESRFIGRQTIWGFAHNLSFDLVTTRLPLALIGSGWTITDAAVGGRAPWMRLRKGSNRLTLADSGSWFPQPLQEIGNLMGITKPPLPSSGDSKSVWLARCLSDVDILATAMDQLMGWWDDNELGRFTITGAACGWNAYRHVSTVQRVVIDPSPAEVQADRLALHGGRRGVWRVGDIRMGRLLELDFTAAYPRVAAELALPVRRSVGFDSLRPDDYRLRSSRWGVIAEVEVETEQPLYPVRWSGATWYPVGRFKCHLAGPEIAEAARLGVLRAIGPGHVHQLGHAMMPWARWCLATQNGEIEDTPPAARLAAKQWGRSVIGKWASHSFVRTELGPSPVAGWGYEEGWDHASGTRGGMVDIGGRRWWVAAAAEPDNAYPGVAAWVESEVRLRLSRVLAALGSAGPIQCDTDGLIVTAESLVRWAIEQADGNRVDMTDDQWISAACGMLNELVSPLTIRVKRSYDSARVLGPQHVETPTERRFSGLPKHATRKGENTYTGKIWPKLQWQMGNGDDRGYVRPDITSVIEGPFANGWVLSTGEVVPCRFIVTDTGESLCLPWELMPREIRERTLAPKQHKALEGLSWSPSSTVA